MPDADNDRQGEHGDGGGEVVVVKCRQVAGGAAAAYQHHTVVGICHRSDVAQGFDDGGRCLVALHHRREQAHIEAQAIGVVEQLVNEIPISGGSGCRYDGDALGYCRTRQFAIVIDDTRGGEALNHLGSASQQLAQGVLGVDVGDGRRDAI